uniref:BTB domain-containing protein n=1 Tax=Panagrolaimus davidi TaxID=227884 RepID=A0A914QGH1_9BILA
MTPKVTLVTQSELSLYLKTTITFDKNFEFIVNPIKDSDGKKYFIIEDVKGDLEITSVKRRLHSGSGGPICCGYDDTTKIFSYDENYDIYKYFFIFTISVNMKKVTSVTYQLQIPAARMHFLEIHEFFESKIVLPDFGDLAFPYTVKKSIKPNIFEINIENPHNARINGTKADYMFEHLCVYPVKDVNVCLSFIFESTVISETGHNVTKNNESAKVSSNDTTKSQKRKSSAKENDERNSQPLPKKFKNDPPKWYEIMSNKKYSDVTLISSDNIQIPSHRCVLSKHSQIFAKIIDETSELPITINIEGFNGETIQAASDILYDKTDSINGKEMEIFKFAERYDIQNIMDACCSYFEEFVDVTNVCEYIQIAYSKNFEELKQKCLKILVEKKKEIDASKFADLPKNILIDAFCF